jgi:hypothetical protein
MTNLLDFAFTFDIANNPYKLPGSLNHRAMIAELSWMVSLNRRSLTHLGIADIPHNSAQSGFRDFCRAISELTEMRELDLSIETRKADIFQSGMDVFFSCPPSLRRLWLCVFEGDEETGEDEDEEDGGENDNDDSTKSANESLQGDQSRSGQDGNEEQSLLVPRRQEPLGNLEMLVLWGIGAQDSTSDVLSVFAHCPNIKQLSIVSLAGDREIDVIGEYIGRECPKIESLLFSSTGDSANDFLSFRIMDVLPVQQLKDVRLDGLLSNMIALTANLPLLGRHFNTLQRIVLDRTGSIGRISIASVFKECNSLEDLHIECRKRSGAFMNLSDAVKEPWKCLKLRRLI